MLESLLLRGDPVSIKQRHTRDEWDQRKTMLPPPYTGAMRRVARGVGVGDALYDSLDKAVLIRGIHDPACLPSVDHPPWVDWDLVDRGQALWKEYIGPSFLALSGALLQGFSIARFSEVLVATGYSSSPDATAARFQATGFHILDWWRVSLKSPDSASRLGIRTVRAMHAYARRHALEKAVLGEGEGLPLSQYDMGETQMGFGIICLYIITEELRVPLTQSEKEAMLSVWRLVGYHLGIEDEYNTCVSLPDAEALYADYMEWSELRFATVRPSTHLLQRNFCLGFGAKLPLGVQFWKGFCDLLGKTGVLRVQSKDPEAYFTKVDPLGGMWVVATLVLRFACTRRARTLMGKRLVQEQHTYKSNPEAFKSYQRRLGRVATVFDNFVWPCFSVVYWLFTTRILLLVSFAVWLYVVLSPSQTGST